MRDPERALHPLARTWQFAGVSVDDLTSAFKRLNKALLDAREPTSEAAAVFTVLGLNVSELRDRDPAKTFEPLTTSTT